LERVTMQIDNEERFEELKTASSQDDGSRATLYVVKANKLTVSRPGSDDSQTVLQPITPPLEDCKMRLVLFCEQVKQLFQISSDTDAFLRIPGCQKVLLCFLMVCKFVCFFLLFFR
jgi:hypothetical protein